MACSFNLSLALLHNSLIKKYVIFLDAMHNFMIFFSTYAQIRFLLRWSHTGILAVGVFVCMCLVCVCVSCVCVWCACVCS